MIITMKNLIVDGVELPTPVLTGTTHSYNKLWSSNTGRLENSGTMVGTITAVKEKLEIQWPDLTAAQARIIADATAGTETWHTLEYADQDGVAHKLSVYFGDFTYTLKDNRTRGRIIQNAKISAIER